MGYFGRRTAELRALNAARIRRGRPRLPDVAARRLALAERRVTRLLALCQREAARYAVKLKLWERSKREDLPPSRQSKLFGGQVGLIRARAAGVERSRRRLTALELRLAARQLEVGRLRGASLDVAGGATELPTAVATAPPEERAEAPEEAVAPRES